MAQLAISLAGAAAGNFILPGIGGQIGFALGSVVGGYLTQPKPPTLYGPKIEDGTVTSSAYGGMIPKIWGTVSVPGNIIDNGPLVTEAIEEEVGGGKGAPTQKSVTYTQYMDYDVAICDGADAIVQIYMNEKLYYDASPNATIQQPAWLQFTFYNGSDTQEVDPTFEVLRGVGNVPAYRGVSHIVFKRLSVTEVGTTAINFRFVVTSNGTESVVDWEYAQETGTVEKALSITHNKYSDLMIGSIYRNEDADEPLQTLVAIDPYSHQEVWSAYRADSLNDGFCLVGRIIFVLSA